MWWDGEEKRWRGGPAARQRCPCPWRTRLPLLCTVPVLAEGVQHLCPQDLWAEQELEGRRSASTSSEFLPTPAALPRGGLA